ncbi:MAG: GTP 3',8-cyclase MoaA [Syntrophomonadaceae bacterium]|nr:GTP 3',8-cyclase MoaA [Syntrophomonadaceae bacterium]
MQDVFCRNIDYLRISITDKCNLRCVYCMPEEGIKLKPHREILRFEEILRLVKVASGLGIKRVRLTGGEPLVRRGVENFVRKLIQIPGIEDVAMTTNGILLTSLGPALKRAGLKRVNVSLDTLQSKKFRKITRVGDLHQVWEGIETALDIGLHPVKLNMVVMRGYNDDEILDFVKLVYLYPLHVRFIECMPIGEADGWAQKQLVSQEEIKARVAEHYPLEPCDSILGSGPAQYYRLSGALGSVGFISPITAHFCPTCNRLRLTADGRLRPCLNSQWEIDVKSPLRAGATDAELRDIFLEAALRKPRRHNMSEAVWNQPRMMYQIGG